MKMQHGGRRPPALLTWDRSCVDRFVDRSMVAASAVFAPPPLNDVRTVVVLVRSVQATPSVLVCKER